MKHAAVSRRSKWQSNRGWLLANSQPSTEALGLKAIKELGILPTAMPLSLEEDSSPVKSADET